MKRTPKPSLRQGSGESAPAADDDEFARAMAEVMPLGRDRPERVPLGPPDRPPASRERWSAPAASEAAQDAGTSFVAPGVDRRELRRLTRGEYRVDRRMDLHGFTADEALARVNRFLEGNRHARHRVVCVVHGRGLNSKGGIAILKTRVRELLRTHPAVLAFVDAPPADGGVGAVYVLLRK